MARETIIPNDYVGKPDGYPEQLEPAEVDRRFRALLGTFEKPIVPLNLRVLREQELDGSIRRQDVTYDVAPGETVPACHLFRKDLPKDAPGVLSIHAHGSDEIFPVGREYHCRPDEHDPSQYSYRAAQAGFRVLAPDALCFGERRTPWGYTSNFFDEIAVHAELTGRGFSLAWKSVFDNTRAIEALQTLGAPSIGTIGHSGGSTQNYILTAVQPKVKAAVCFASFATLREQFYRYRLSHCLYHYIPGMVKAGLDWDQVVALAAPRKFFLAWGTQDAGTPEDMVQAFVKAIRIRCRKEGLPESVEVCREDAGHSITETMLTRALQFLRENLRPG